MTVSFWKRLWPFVSTNKHAADLAEANARTVAAEKKSEQQRRHDNQRHAAELEDRTQRVDRIIMRLGEIQWSGPGSGNRYALQLSFDPRMIDFGNMEPCDLQLIAERFARQVEREIATSKFVQSARDDRSRMRIGALPSPGESRI